MQKFPCKYKETQPDGTVKECPEQIEYEDETANHIVLYHFNRPSTLPPRPKKKTVYLTCDAGHTFPYTVTVPQEES